MITVMFKKLDDKAIAPSYESETAVGLNLCSLEEYSLLPGSFRVFRTGLACQLDWVGSWGTRPKLELQIRSHNELAASDGITVLGAPITIDEGFEGELAVALINRGKDIYTVRQGEKIALLVPNTLPQARAVVADAVGT